MPATLASELAPLRLDPQVARHLRGCVAQLAHDLRQPLSIIETCAYLIETRLPDADGLTREQLELVLAQIEEISRLLDQTLRASQEGERHLEQEDAASSRSLTNAAMAAVT